jgi:hypothetical protein
MLDHLPLGWRVGIEYEHVPRLALQQGAEPGQYAQVNRLDLRRLPE